MSTFRVQVVVRSLPLSRGAVAALKALKRYDLIVFTSNHARAFFLKALKQLHIQPPAPRQVVQVGPRNELLKFSVRGKRILFPRSALAPHDIVRKLRALGATVRVLPLYTAQGAHITVAQKKALLSGKIKTLYFKSPSGIAGFLQQLHRSEQQEILALSAKCIGETTARAARQAGFKKVSIAGIL